MSSSGLVSKIERYLEAFDFENLFADALNWGYATDSDWKPLPGHKVRFRTVAELGGFPVLLIEASSGAVPDSAERVRIERALSAVRNEHVSVYAAANKSKQVWQIPVKEAGRFRLSPALTYYRGRGCRHVVRRLEALKFSIEEASTATVLDVAHRAKKGFDAEKVTKRFFDSFKDLREGNDKKGIPGLVKFLTWIADESKREWYCSVLLNRLMFIYFIGEQGFLPDGREYLTRRMQENRAKNGPDTFYTHFLLPFSFFGLGQKQTKRGRFEETFKDVLYLDGGLFTVHQVERELGLNKEAVEKGVFPVGAKIPDIEFKRWFDYFDKWRWTLDEDKVENDGYISPHILGYIFEKYINQKQMGAYYTKEDITGYICRNTIIPRLFDMLAETGEKGKKSVRPLPVGPHPNLLNDGRGISDGEGIDRYIYASVKQEAKLPTETDYELEQRRKRYEGILEDFDAEKIQGIDDFITYNLDIEKLALDFVSNIQDPEVLHAFYFKGLQQITVLDPTCGSGAFLFEALIILYPLYNACLSRMRYLVGKATGEEPDVVNWGGRLHFDDLDVDGSTLVDLVQGGGTGSKVLNDLRAEVERINDHPSAEYFIKKSIIVNNLFGVDIMEEAVEICKLRLFLTLIATVERDDAKDNFGVEPLPDIDFNILPGNTLVGYTSIADIDRLWDDVSSRSNKTKAGGTIKQQSMDKLMERHEKLERDVQEYGRLLKSWRLQQLGEWKGAPISKEQVIMAVGIVRPGLHEDIWKLYKTADLATKQVKVSGGKSKAVELTQAEFRATHEPFHWLLEFPAIEAAGGFDVVVGNPPFLDLKTTKIQYSLIPSAFTSVGCGNLYALCVERCVPLAHVQGRFGMIMPVSAISTDGFRPIQRVFESQSLAHIPSFDDRPAKLFDGLEHIRTCIAILKRGSETSAVFTSNYNKWLQVEREHLFANLSLTESGFEQDGTIPKLSSPLERDILSRLFETEERISDAYLGADGVEIYFARKVGYFLNIYDFVPTVRDSVGNLRMPSEFKTLSLKDDQTAKVWLAVLNSSLFNWYFTTHSDCRHLNKREIESFPFGVQNLDSADVRRLGALSERLMMKLRETSEMRSMSAPSGRLEVECIFPRRAKDIIDQIDDLLGDVLGFSAEQVGYIKNYDAKYRLGLAGVSEDSEDD